MLLFVTGVTHSADGCPVPSDEKLVCEVVLCNPLGIVISESRSECLQVNRRFAIYLATLGFWDKPPKCKLRDKNCNKVGNASSAEIDPQYCDELGSEAEQDACRMALGAPPSNPGYCEEFDGDQRDACEARMNNP